MAEQKLFDRISLIENELTASLGFVLPEKLCYDDVMVLLTTIDEPLRTTIKEKLLTRRYGLDDYDYRWIVIGTLVKFGMQFGNTRQVGFDIAEAFYEEITKLSDKVFILLQNPENFPQSQYGYLKCAVGSLIRIIDGWNDGKLKLVNRDNFIMIEEKHTSKYFGVNSAFSGISEAITAMAKSNCRDVPTDCYNGGLPGIVNRLQNIDNVESLLEFKDDLYQKARLMAVFSEIIDDLHK